MEEIYFQFVAQPNFFDDTMARVLLVAGLCDAFGMFILSVFMCHVKQATFNGPGKLSPLAFA